MEIITAVTASQATVGVLVATIVGGARWFWKIEKGLNQAIKSGELLTERLNGHEAVGNERHEALSYRISLLERVKRPWAGP